MNRFEMMKDVVRETAQGLKLSESVWFQQNRWQSDYCRLYGRIICRRWKRKRLSNTICACKRERGVGEVVAGMDDASDCLQPALSWLLRRKWQEGTWPCFAAVLFGGKAGADVGLFSGMESKPLAMLTWRTLPCVVRVQWWALEYISRILRDDSTCWFSRTARFWQPKILIGWPREMSVWFFLARHRGERA